MSDKRFPRSAPNEPDASTMRETPATPRRAPIAPQRSKDRAQPLTPAKAALSKLDAVEARALPSGDASKPASPRPAETRAQQPPEPKPADAGDAPVAANQEATAAPKSEVRTAPKPPQRRGERPGDKPGLFKRAGGIRSISRDDVPTTFVDCRDDGLNAFRHGAYDLAADRLERAHALRPDVTLVKRTLAEAMLRLGRAQEAYDFANDALVLREDLRLRRTRTYAARALLREALLNADADTYVALMNETRDDIDGGARGAPFLFLLGAMKRDRADVKGAIAQMVARARFAAAKAQKAASAAPAGAEIDAGRAAEEGRDPGAALEPDDPSLAKRRRIPTEAERISMVFDAVADDARALFAIDDAGACFALDVAISIAPDEPRLRAERLWFGLERGEIENPNQLLDYALDRRVYGARLRELDRLCRFIAELRAPDAATRALRALKTRLRSTLAAMDPPPAALLDAGVVALDFGDFSSALAARDRLVEAPSDEEVDAALAALNAALEAARLAVGDLEDLFDAAAATFWNDILTARDPLEAFFEQLPEDAAAMIAPPRLATADAEETGLRSYRRTLFTAMRLLSRRNVRHRLVLFPWSSRELERTPRGKPIFAHRARRGPRTNLFLTHAEGPLPGVAMVDRFGVDGWSETARSLPFVEVRSSEVAAHLDIVRAQVFGAAALDAPMEERPDDILVLLQKASDPRLELSRISPRDMLRTALTWAERRGRRVRILRPASCKHLGVTDMLDEVTKIGDATIERAPTAPGEIGRLACTAACLVTINAPAALEAMLMLRPTLLCGDADFHHAAKRIETTDQLTAALDEVDARVDAMGMARFFYDYMNGPMINLLAPIDLETKLTQKLREAGWLPSARS